MKRLAFLLALLPSLAWGQSIVDQFTPVIASGAITDNSLLTVVGGRLKVASPGSASGWATVTGTLTAGNVPILTANGIADSGVSLVSTLGANVIYMNPTGVSAAPTSVTVPDCNGAAKALNTTAGGGASFFTCNSSITAAALSATPTIASSTTGASTQTFTNSPCSSSLTTEQWIPVMITGQTGTWYIPACK